MTRFMIGAATIAIASMPCAARAQLAVIDSSTYAQTLATVRNTLRMIEQGREQLDEARRLYGSMNKLTGVNERGSILNSSAVRNLLPPEVREMEQLMKADLGSSALGSRTDKIFRDAQLDTGLIDGSDEERAYNDASKRAAKQSATSAAVAETAYDVSSQRTEGLEDLRLALDTASDAKEVGDLQARATIEAAHIQNDQVKLQSIAMRQAAQQQLDLRADDARMLRDLRSSFGNGK